MNTRATANEYYCIESLSQGNPPGQSLCHSPPFCCFLRPQPGSRSRGIKPLETSIRPRLGHPFGSRTLWRPLEGRAFGPRELHTVWTISSELIQTVVQKCREAHFLPRPILEEQGEGHVCELWNKGFRAKECHFRVPGHRLSLIMCWVFVYGSRSWVALDRCLDLALLLRCGVVQTQLADVGRPMGLSHCQLGAETVGLGAKSDGPELWL